MKVFEDNSRWGRKSMDEWVRDTNVVILENKEDLEALTLACKVYVRTMNQIPRLVLSDKDNNFITIIQDLCNKLH